MVVLVVAFVWPADGMPQGPRDPWLIMAAAVHVHSTLSTGTDSLDALAAEAESSGIDALLLTDNFLLRFEYGLFPFRGLIRRTVEFPSVWRGGISRFLSDVRGTNLRHPRVLLIAGVEVVPLYYWTGSVFSKNLTMHDAQKNLLALGLQAEDDYARLPVAGNPAAYEHGWWTIAALSPLLLVPPGIWLISRRVERRVRVGWTSMVVRSRRTVPGAVLLVLAALLLVNNYPFGTPPHSLYDDGQGLRPHQHVIDYVRERGGLTVWSMPEARDFHQLDYGRLGIVTVKTDPYPEVLSETSGYTGFGAVHLDQNTIAEPGGPWDAVLSEYARGRRSAAPPWGFGEIAYHGADSTKKYMADVQTVCWVKERTPKALLEAMAHGRMYAVQRTKEYGLTLADFSLVASQSGASAISGQTLRATASDAVQVRVAVGTSDGRPRPLSLRFVRDGRVIAKRTETSPFQMEFADRAPAPGETAYYRLLIGSPGTRLVSNPIFVRGEAAPAMAQ